MRRFELRPSPRLALVIAAAHVAAAAGAWISLGGGPGVMLAVALLALGATAIRSHALLSAADSVRAIEIGPAGVIVEFPGGKRVEAEIAERRYVSRWLVVLRLRRPAGRAVLVAPDMLSEDAFRVLRLWALWGQLPAGAQAPATPASAVH